MAMIERQLPFYHRYAYINHCLGAINIVTSSHYTILGQDRVATPSLTHSITHPPTTSSLTENGGCMVPKLSQQKLANCPKGLISPKNISRECIFFCIYIYIYILLNINNDVNQWKLGFLIFKGLIFITPILAWILQNVLLTCMVCCERGLWTTQKDHLLPPWSHLPFS